MREGGAERHDRLLNLVRERGTVRVADLAGRLGVSVVTARRDVEALASRGLLDRTHGAVSWPADRGPAGTPVGGGPVIGMLAPAAAYYFAEVIRGAHEAAARLGARLILRVTDYRPEDDAAHAAGLLAAGAQGLLLAPSWTEPEHRARYSDWIARLPVEKVLVEREGEPGGPLEELDRVGSDHAHGVLLAVRHLVRLGHGTPMLVARTDSPTARAVRAGYGRALETLGLAGTEPLIAATSAERDPALFERSALTVRNAVREGRASSVLVHNDEDAIRMVRRLAELGVRVPDDLALITYDDEVAALADTPLTAVAPPKREVGRCAAELLVERLSGPRYPGSGEAAPRRRVALLPTLRVRGSCGRPGTEEADRLAAV
ncbi:MULTISPECIES: substrate-binding domain-containing protein [unclassified Streptomyces]|uniref:substrate-binding domain-containing protein n=1 Tax=unclassified Streptomyces TaxID=2593676 RepID=UPI00081EBA00|nr:substrate-binding domain-containing protein [Streptomyces sp. ScaeMP-e83]MYR96547.1 substrate-binding domain-containing protein [Streptomyces sp. SID4937]SCE11925.1 DNA-binding transcriptional regulator, LacI/PurR family [Streptomyces sp. ScaeMP-e83]